MIDVQALVHSGESLDVAIADAPKRDGGFSPLTLACVLRDLDGKALADPASLASADVIRMEAFRQELIDRLIEPHP